MDKALFISVVVLGITIIIIHLFDCLKHEKPFNHSNLVNTMLLSTGIMSGLCLMAGTVIPEFEKLLEDSELYIFISGLTILAVSIHQLHNDILAKALTKKGSYVFFAIVFISFFIAMAIYLDI